MRGDDWKNKLSELWQWARKRNYVLSFAFAALFLIFAGSKLMSYLIAAVLIALGVKELQEAKK